MKKVSLLFITVITTLSTFAQGTFSGDFMSNLSLYQRDTAIRASGNPLYDNALSGSEAWLGLRYNIKGFTFYFRADAFNNSNLKNPTSPSTDFGVGAWSITKQLKDMTISVGYIYDQIGSGILFRAYEDRGLLIDNALVGVELKYKLTKHISIKGFTGQIKNNSIISTDGALHTPPYGPVVKGLNAEGDFKIGNIRLIPGVGFLNRTLDQNSYQTEAARIQAQAADTTGALFTPVYNMYAGTFYNTLTYKGFSWYVEGAYKSHEAIVNTLVPPDKPQVLVDTPGNIEYTTINYGQKGWALGLVGKRTQNFVMRTSANETLLDGLMNWQPVVAIQRPERLISRYTPASQDISEMAGTANLYLAPTDVTSMNFTYTHIDDLAGNELYREAYGDIFYQGFQSWRVQFGLQYLEYNLEVYYDENKVSPILKALTPMTEITYRIDEKRSLRMELQYMFTQQDYGAWAFALLEFNIAPKYSISVSDMYNTMQNSNGDSPNKNLTTGQLGPANHYYNVYLAYTKDANRFSIAYVKQVDGINCTGGVCRYEPAFSGVKATITSSF